MTEERMKYYFQDSKGQTWEEFKENILEPDESYEECYRKISRVLINYGSHEMPLGNILKKYIKIFQKYTVFL